MSGHIGATVTIKGERRHKRKEISTSQLKREEIEKVVATAQDPLRALPTLPGVSAASDLSVRPVVRGGDLAETGVSLDGVPLLMPYHFGSVFSVFHKEALEEFQLYTGVAPASSEGRLSGSVMARTRPPPTDTVLGGLDLSMLRGSAWLGIPVIKDKLGVWVSAQSVWYDWTLKRLMDIGAVLGFADEKSVSNYKSTTTLPTASDAQAGVSWKPSKEWIFDMTGFVTKDSYRSLERINTCWAGDMEVPCSGMHVCYYQDPPFGSYLCSTGQRIVEKKSMDTAAIVGLSSWLGRGRLAWSPDQDLSLEVVASAQQVDWSAEIPGNRDFANVDGKYKVIRTDVGKKFEWNRIALDGQISARKRWNEIQESSIGFGTDRGEERVRTHLERPIAQMILGTTGNPLEYLGLYNESSMLVLDGSLRSYADIDQLADFDFDYSSNSSRLTSSGWFEHRWDPDASTRVRAGARLAVGGDGKWDVPNPRVQVQRQITEKDLFGVGFALHTQSDLPFDWRVGAPTPLSSEKAWLGIAEWEHQFAPGWRSTVSGWGKYYTDLASPQVVAVGAIDSASVMWAAIDWIWANNKKVGLPDSVLQDYGVPYDPSLTMDEMRRLADSVQAAHTRKILSYVPQSVMRDIEWWNSKRKLQYASTGIGWAAGIEASLRYQPTQGWTGWASVEWSMSRRKDSDDGIWYPFGLERPWKISWVNAFQIDKKWEIDVRYAAMGGNPYTPYRLRENPYGQSAEGDTIIWIGSRNSGSFSPYQRLDLRVSRKSTVLGFPTTFYYEIWNAFNDPNTILRDERTGEFKMFQYNLPIPMVFLGGEVRF